MLICEKCGADNQLGRVFCERCGTKLDLTHMSQDVVAQALQKEKIGVARHWRKIALGIGLAVLIPLLLAMIPTAGPIGDKGTLVGGRRVESLLRQLGGLRSGQAVTATFEEQDINGYLEFVKSKALEDMGRISMEIHPGYARLHLESYWFRFSLFNFEWQPKKTRELILVPAGAGGMAAIKAKTGRLPLIGPFRGMLIRRLHRRMYREQDWKGFAFFSEVEMTDDKIKVVARGR